MTPGIRDILEAKASFQHNSNRFLFYPHVGLLLTIRTRTLEWDREAYGVEYDSDVK